MCPSFFTTPFTLPNCPNFEFQFQSMGMAPMGQWMSGCGRQLLHPLGAPRPLLSRSVFSDPGDRMTAFCSKHQAPARGSWLVLYILAKQPQLLAISRGILLSCPDANSCESSAFRDDASSVASNSHFDEKDVCVCRPVCGEPSGDLQRPSTFPQASRSLFLRLSSSH